eukprot:SAG22_NODE_683_length_7924_cov_13.017508_6_plen_316_part_00
MHAYGRIDIGARPHRPGRGARARVHVRLDHTVVVDYACIVDYACTAQALHGTAHHDACSEPPSSEPTAVLARSSKLMAWLVALVALAALPLPAASSEPPSLCPKALPAERCQRRGGGDFHQFSAANHSVCADACCADARCGSWNWDARMSVPATMPACRVGGQSVPCCYLKGGGLEACMDNATASDPAAWSGLARPGKPLPNPPPAPYPRPVSKTDDNAAGVPAARASCSSSHDCSHNGVCGSAQACECAPQWTGPACATLVRLPADKQRGFHSPHVRGQGNGTSSWGGSILLDAQTSVWHMYSAEMINDCGIGD